MTDNNSALVLMVDDNPNNLALLGYSLKKNKYRVAEAENGQKALEFIEHTKPDIILLDVMMPGLDGYDVCQRLKDNEDTKNIPVIFLSAKSDSESTLKGLKIGAVDYIGKPFNKLELIAKIKTHLELKRTREELAAMNSQLQEANASKDKLFSIIAHDLRGPIANFNAMIETLVDDPDSFEKEEAFDLLSDLKKSTSGTLNLLENLLQWARSQRDKIPYEPIIISLNDLIEENIELLTSNAINKNITLRSNIREKIEVFADRNTVTTVIRNLLNNAIKFTPEQGTITVHATDEGKFYKVTVEDTGVGIDQEDISKLFRLDVHHTTQGTQKEKGTGLGLILCKEFVEKNGGEISVESKKHIGSKFSFTIPKQSS